MSARPKTSANKPQARFRRESYERHKGEISLHMSHFFLGYLRSLHREFDGDLALVIVLGEIAHHNLSDHFSEAGLDRSVTRDFYRGASARERLATCNAYSLANATGLPRETIRRKIAFLERWGWVERAQGRNVRITPALAKHFQPDFNLELTHKLLSTAERIRMLLNS